MLDVNISYIYRPSLLDEINRFDSTKKDKLSCIKVNQKSP